MSKINHIPSVIHYTICGTVCFQFTHFCCDDWENIYTLSYYHHQIVSMNYYPLFRVRSWNNGVRCMSFCILTVCHVVEWATWNICQWSFGQTKENVRHKNAFEKVPISSRSVFRLHSLMTTLAKFFSACESINISFMYYRNHCDHDEILMNFFKLVVEKNVLRKTSVLSFHIDVNLPFSILLENIRNQVVLFDKYKYRSYQTNDNVWPHSLPTRVVHCFVQALF